MVSENKFYPTAYILFSENLRGWLNVLSESLGDLATVIETKENAV